MSTHIEERHALRLRLRLRCLRLRRSHSLGHALPMAEKAKGQRGEEASGWGSSLWGLLPGKAAAKQATLGDENTMVYDKERKRWIDKVRHLADFAAPQYAGYAHAVHRHGVLPT